MDTTNRVTRVADIQNRHKGVARALGIEAFNRGMKADSLFDNGEMKCLCAGYNSVMVKQLINAFIKGWQVQAAVCGVYR